MMVKLSALVTSLLCHQQPPPQQDGWSLAAALFVSFFPGRLFQEDSSGKALLGRRPLGITSRNRHIDIPRSG